MHLIFVLVPPFFCLLLVESPFTAKIRKEKNKGKEKTDFF